MLTDTILKLELIVNYYYLLQYWFYYLKYLIVIFVMFKYYVAKL